MTTGLGHTWSRPSALTALASTGVVVALVVAALGDGAGTQAGAPVGGQVPTTSATGPAMADATSPSADLDVWIPFVTEPLATTATTPEPDVVVVPSTEVTSGGCDPLVPIDVIVPDAEAEGGPAPGTPAPTDGQLVRHWTAEHFTVELRWPPDPRPVEDPMALGPPIVGGWGTNSSQALTVTDMQTDGVEHVLYTVATHPGADLLELPWACRLVQIRIDTDDGRTETYGYRLPFSPSADPVVGLGPLVSDRQVVSTPLRLDRTTLCPEDVGDATLVLDAPAAPTPVDALRDFLAGEASATVPRPTSMRPYTETRLLSDGTYRYEHYVAWSDYVAITVQPRGDGWAVTGWVDGAC